MTPQVSRPEPVIAKATAAVIGRSIIIRGEVSGDEDLVIQGRVEGSVDLKQHSVTVGPDGVVNASITARVVTIEGAVEGDLTGEEVVLLRASARVHGDIVAPRVVLEDGTVFRGSVEMGESARREKRPVASVGAKSANAAAPAREALPATPAEEERMGKAKDAAKQPAEVGR
jgi:cytoskeletal protein CcmA (bactofilin family)